jgi:type I restriction enzyme M protein
LQYLLKKHFAVLIRICEDKGILPQPLISGSGLKNWRKNIERYWVFAQGNPYDPLLDIAYTNARNIYAHFFTGPKLFNWYRLDQRHSEIVLDLLECFDFTGIHNLTNVVVLLDNKQRCFDRMDI